jgi:hypothetical protein
VIEQYKESCRKKNDEHSDDLNCSTTTHIPHKIVCE